MASELVALAREGPLVVGLDFAFGFPAWFARSLGAATIDDVWRTAELDGEAWLSGCSPPFWGRPGAKQPPDDPVRLALDGRVPSRLLDTATSAEDPFDAAISGLEMARHVDEIQALRVQPDYALEGAIWRPDSKPDPSLPD